MFKKKKKKKKVVETVFEGKKLEFPVNIPPVLRNLALQCWEINPAKRPTASDFIEKMEEIIFLDEKSK